MPLQRLAMDSDYSERLINPLRQKIARNPPLAVLISSNRKIMPSPSFPLFFNGPLRLPGRNYNLRRPCALLRETSQQRLANFGPFRPGLNCKSMTRKFADFCADEEVTVAREIPSSIPIQYPRQNIVPNNIHANHLNFILPARLVSEQGGQPTTMPNPEDANTSSTFQHHGAGKPEDQSTFSSSHHATAKSESTRLLHLSSSESNAPVNNWRQAVVSSCVVGVALVAVATGYAYATVFRGALNVGHFVYANRNNIQQTSATCSKAVQSAYNAAKRRMVSIPVPRFPVGMRRRYAPPPSPQDRSRQRRFFWQSRNSARPPARPLPAVNPVTSVSAPHGMPGVEYSGLSSDGRFPDREDTADPDAFVYPRSPGEAVPIGLYMTSALFHPSTSPLPSLSTANEEPAPENSRKTTAPDEIELSEQSCVFYEESVFSEDIEDEYVVEDGENANNPTAEPFNDDEEEHMEQEQDFWSIPG